MKKWPRWRIVRLGLGLMVVLALAGGGCAPVGAHHRSVALGVRLGTHDGVFRFLAGYGEWIVVPPFGYVWRPAVAYGWRPFYHGHWAWCSAGWTWVSYEPFGWIVYHYGYWYRHPAYGWIWIPGGEWSPARVRWVTIGAWVAWAPLAPPGYRIPDPFPGPYGWPYDRSRRGLRTSVWLFVRIEDMVRRDVGRLARTTIVFRHRRRAGTIIYRPPEIERVRRAGRRIVRIPEVQIQTVRLGNRKLRRPVPVSEWNRRMSEAPVGARIHVQKHLEKTSAGMFRTSKPPLQNRDRQ